MNNDYARHVRRTWVDTHNQSIRTDPEIYLPGEVDEDAEDGDSDESDESDENHDDGENEDGISNVFAGMKRKTTIRTRDIFPAKVAKRMAQTSPSTATLNVIGDRRADLTLIDTPVGENVLSHPYGRHSCLYMKVKVNANKRPNPQEVVCPFFLRVPVTEPISPNRSRRRQAKPTRAY